MPPESPGDWARARAVDDHESLPADVTPEVERLVEERIDARHGPCVCLHPQDPACDGPAEDCPHHGRSYADWVDYAHRQEQRALGVEEQLRAAQARLDRLTGELRRFHR